MVPDLYLLEGHLPWIILGPLWLSISHTFSILKHQAPVSIALMQAQEHTLKIPNKLDFKQSIALLKEYIAFAWSTSSKG